MKIRLSIIVAACLLCLTICLAGCAPKTLATPTELEYDGAVLFWSPVEGADRYEVSLDGEIVASPTSAYYEVSVTQGTFRVRAMGGKGKASDWSEPLTHTTRPDRPQALTTPTVLEVDGEGTLRWTPVMGAIAYRVWVNTELYVTVETSYCTLTLEGDGYRTIQVSAVAGEGFSDSARSASYRIELSDGRVVAPKISAVVVTFEPSTRQLVWSAVRNAVGYAVYGIIGDNTRLMATVDTDPAKAGYSYLVNPQEGGATYWVVALADMVKYANSAESNRISFPLDAEPAPTNLHVDVIEGIPHLMWDAIGAVNGYEVRLERDGETRLLTVTEPYTRIRSDGEWAVSVRGLGDDKIYRSTMYSAQIDVKVEGGDIAALPTDAPYGIYLLDNVLYWNAVSYSAAYQVMIDTPVNDEVGQYLLTATDNRLEVDSHLWDVTLEVYVRALGQEGHATSPWSEGYTFVPTLYDEEGLPLPKEYSFLAPPSPVSYDGETFYWTEIGGCSGYQVVVDGEVYETDVNRLPLAKTGSTVVKVRAMSATEGVLSSAYTTEYTFRFPQRLDTPTGLSQKGDLLSWDMVPGAVRYVIRVGRDRFETTSTNLHMALYLPYDGSYDLAVMAVGEGVNADSLWSEWMTFVVDYEEEGTQHKPYAISCAEDLDLLGRYPGAYFALTQDVAVGEVESLFDYTNVFTGHLDGKGYSLTDIRVHGTAQANGLFGYLMDASLTDIGFEFAEVVWGEYRVGGLLAAYLNNSTLTDVRITATASRSTSFGVVGIALGSTFTRVSADIRLEGNGGVLGLVGQATDCLFEEVAVCGSLQAGPYTSVGGLVGQVGDCDFVGVQVGTSAAPLLVSGGSNAGAIVGTGDGDIEDALVYATLTGSGNMGSAGYWSGDFDGEVVLKAILMGDASVGALAGRGGGKASGAFDLTVEGEVSTLSVGVLWGAGDRAEVEQDTLLTLTLTARADSGFVGGVIGAGRSDYTGITYGTVTTSVGVAVGRISGLDEEIDEHWSVSKE